MTNSQAADHGSWLVRCFPRALGFSQSNQHNYIQGFWKNNIGKGGVLKIFLKGGGGIKAGGLFKRGGGSDKCPLQTMMVLE